MQTRVGYAGGRESNPTYRDIGGHAEALRVVFDPDLLAFEDLLGHLLGGRRHLGGYGQYRSAVFPRDDAQLRAVQSLLRGDSLRSLTERDGVVPPGRPTSRFWDAEDYHQKYYLRRRRPFVAALEQHFGPAWDQYPVATKLNTTGAANPHPWLALLPPHLADAYLSRP